MSVMVIMVVVSRQVFIKIGCKSWLFVLLYHTIHQNLGYYFDIASSYHAFQSQIESSLNEQLYGNMQVSTVVIQHYS